MADWGDPGRGDAIADLGSAEQSVDQRAMMAEEPPHLPWLEDRGRRRREASRAGQKAA